MSYILRVVDLETTGLAPPHTICEVATVDLIVNDDETVERGEAWSTLINPGRQIPPEASAIHHIIDADVIDAPTFDAKMAAHITRSPLFALAAHNDRFDRQWFDPPGAKWIDTYRVALWLWPNCPVHSNQCLRYWLNLRLTEVPVPHRAPGDAYVTAALLRRAIMVMLDKSIDLDAVLEQLIQVSSRPALLPKFSFGKWAMKPIAQVPEDYLRWMLDQKDMNQDARHTAAVELQSRRQREDAA